MLYCRLLVQVLGNRHIRLTPAAANIVSSTLRLWSDGSCSKGGRGYADGQQWEEGEDDGTGDMQLQCEAVQAVAALVRDNLTQVQCVGGQCTIKGI